MSMATAHPMNACRGISIPSGGNVSPQDNPNSATAKFKLGHKVVRSDQLGLPAHAVSLAGAIGRPRLSALCFKQAAMFIAADVRFEAQTQAGQRAESGKVPRSDKRLWA
jgi:hypothetical protein